MKSTVDKKTLKSFEERLQKFGDIEILDVKRFKEYVAAYILIWNGKNTILLKPKETVQIPVSVSVTNDRRVNFKVFTALEKEIKEEYQEKLVKLVNLMNTKNSYAKFYIDDEGDVTGEYNTSLDSYKDEEMIKIMDELLVGFILTILLPVKNNKDE